ncbi:MAG: peptidoglycan bridge formation glycyltransferase FemA/FemB family protein [Patescibacteria group bacterium]|nr:peptidoglycan bridge formation glycyltransferase FemA/FemB family protein [Patescibacteria group bacterium]
MANFLRQSEEYACYMRKKGWKVISVPLSTRSCQPSEKPTAGEAPGASANLAPGARERSGLNHQINTLIKKIPLLGSVIKIQRTTIPPSKKALDNLANKQGALFVKLEPAVDACNQEFVDSHWERDSWPLLATKTLRLNLTQSKKELWNNLDSDAKYSIRKAKRKLKVKSKKLKNTKELKNFHKILKKVGKKQKFPTPSWRNLKMLVECFGKNAWLITASKATHTYRSNNLKNLVAGCLILTHNQTSYYYHAATTKEGRDLLAGYSVLWHAILLAKEKHCTTFDLEGIYDSRYHQQTKEWKGFTHFKKKFGGKIVAYPEPLIKYYSLPIKLLSKIFRS